MLCFLPQIVISVLHRLGCTDSTNNFNVTILDTCHTAETP